MHYDHGYISTSWPQMLSNPVSNIKSFSYNRISCGNIRKEIITIRKIPIIIAAISFIIGCSLLAYPVVSQWVNEHFQSTICAEYSNVVAELDDAVSQEELKKAKEYNDDLTASVELLDDQFVQSEELDNSNYNAILNATEDGVMAYLEIPSIHVMLPIYHGVENGELEKGIGHLPETSLPVGGESTHCVLAGHSGMSNARLLTDLPKLQEGDTFHIHVYNRTLTYTVDQIKTVLPTDTSDLTIMSGEDYVTLATCTPYGVNTHRLLVRGTRTE